MILLDTNVLSELMKGSPNRRVLGWMDHHPPRDLWVSFISQAEIMLGIALLPSGKRQDALALAAATMFAEDFSERCLPFDHAAASHYAQLVAHRTRLGLPISTEDAQIAAIALSHGLQLATRNVKDFGELPGLSVLNPWEIE
jgi:hypothetical protein